MFLLLVVCLCFSFVFPFSYLGEGPTCRLTFDSFFVGFGACIFGLFLGWGVGGSLQFLFFVLYCKEDNNDKTPYLILSKCYLRMKHIKPLPVSCLYFSLKATSSELSIFFLINYVNETYQGTSSELSAFFLITYYYK